MTKGFHRWRVSLGVLALSWLPCGGCALQPAPMDGYGSVWKDVFWEPLFGVTYPVIALFLDKTTQALIDESTFWVLSPIVAILPGITLEGSYRTPTLSRKEIKALEEAEAAKRHEEEESRRRQEEARLQEEEAARAAALEKEDAAKKAVEAEAARMAQRANDRYWIKKSLEAISRPLESRGR